jgi:hypothetical protein
VLAILDPYHSVERTDPASNAIDNATRNEGGRKPETGLRPLATPTGFEVEDRRSDIAHLRATTRLSCSRVLTRAHACSLVRLRGGSEAHHVTVRITTAITTSRRTTAPIANLCFASNPRSRSHRAWRAAQVAIACVSVDADVRA